METETPREEGQTGPPETVPRDADADAEGAAPASDEGPPAATADGPPPQTPAAIRAAFDSVLSPAPPFLASTELTRLMHPQTEEQTAPATAPSWASSPQVAEAKKVIKLLARDVSLSHLSPIVSDLIDRLVSAETEAEYQRERVRLIEAEITAMLSSQGRDISRVSQRAADAELLCDRQRAQIEALERSLSTAAATAQEEMSRLHEALRLAEERHSSEMDEMTRAHMQDLDAMRGQVGEARKLAAELQEEQLDQSRMIDEMRHREEMLQMKLDDAKRDIVRRKREKQELGDKLKEMASALGTAKGVVERERNDRVCQAPSWPF
jgi:hypothetical protein